MRFFAFKGGSEPVEQPEQEADHKGADHHGGKADRPFAGFVVSVKILPALLFRTEDDLVQIEKPVEQDRDNPQEGKDEGQIEHPLQKAE